MPRMRRAALLALALAVAPISAGHAQTDPPVRVTVLKAQRLFDGRSDTVVRDAVVIVEGSRIKSLGARVAIAVPGDPLADIKRMGKVILVMKGGKLYVDPSSAH